MGNCFGRQKQPDGFVVDTRKRSFSKRIDLWEKTGTVAFRSSSLQEFPAEIEDVNPKKVRLLDGSKNGIREIPPYIGQMVSCNRLGLSHNKILSIPDDIGMMQSLRVLLLDHNRLVDVPESLCKLVKLERLSLAHNRLSRLPRGISHLKQLKYIDISSNKMRSITSGIAGCRTLEELRCSDNSISKLPVDLAKLERLRLILAENNRIESVPSAIFMYCESLQTLALHGNPVSMEEIEAVKGFKEFEERRRTKYDKAVSAGVLFGKGAFEEITDRTPTTSNTTG
mmetsp:Transcript_11575/g.23133  ORF Transcript_11575/g.23133 Transcript_11575/m.23133 type:complete len:283 (+) Transcript_11575:66-914(+)